VEDFRTLFLLNPPSLDIVFLFTYTLGHFFLLEQIPDYSLQNTFVGQLELVLLFEVALVIDAAIKKYNPTQNKFSLHATFLAQKGRLNLNQNKLQNQLNSAFQKDIASTLKDILEGKFRFQDGSDLSGLERDLAIAYGLRNYGAHNVTSIPIVWQRFIEIRQSLFNVLFFAVEVLY
jgi:hypothetical protein